MKSRRAFLAGTGAVALTAMMGAAWAQEGQDPIRDILSSPKRGNWDDTFDAQVSASGQPAKVSTTQPIFTPETTANTEAAIEQYRNIVAQGGWPKVPANKKLQLGVTDPNIELLRQRLIVSGDLSAEAGISPSFDTYVDAALKRFQKRHGLPADGVTGKYTYAAMNISAQVRLGQLETNLVRLRTMGGDLGQRYVLVNIPAAQVEAVENDRVVLRHTAIVGKIDRQSPIVNSKINEIIDQPILECAGIDHPQGYHPADAQGPEVPDQERHPHLRAGRQRDSRRSRSTGTRRMRPSTACARIPGKINAMASVKINFPSPDGVYMHDTPSQSLFNKLVRFDSSGCVRVQNVRDLVTWILKNTPGWDRQRFEETIKGGENTPVAVANPVPVYFTYISAWSTGPGVVQFRDDIYGRDGVDELQISSVQVAPQGISVQRPLHQGGLFLSGRSG